MGWTASDMPDQGGRVAVVTGANGGLGLETARALAAKGAHVVMAVRDMEKAGAARRSILDEIPAARLTVRHLDLASLESIRQFATETLREHSALDLLINNAGVMATPQLETADGFEMQFGTNHLGHFVLTSLLMPALLAAPEARVVTVTSTGRFWGDKFDANDPHQRKHYRPWRAYGQSKIANMHFALELDRRLADAGARVRSLVVHPGFSHTDLQSRSVRSSGGGWTQRFWQRTVGWFGMKPDRGALMQLRAATDSGAKGGEFYTPRWVNAGAPVRRPITRRSHNPAAMRVLWDLSEAETGIEFDVTAMVRQGDRS